MLEDKSWARWATRRGYEDVKVASLWPNGTGSGGFVETGRELQLKSKTEIVRRVEDAVERVCQQSWETIVQDTRPWLVGNWTAKSPGLWVKEMTRGEEVRWLAEVRWDPATGRSTWILNQKLPTVASEGTEVGATEVEAMENAATRADRGIADYLEMCPRLFAANVGKGPDGERHSPMPKEQGGGKVASESKGAGEGPVEVERPATVVQDGAATGATSDVPPNPARLTFHVDGVAPPEKSPVWIIGEWERPNGDAWVRRAKGRSGSLARVATIFRDGSWEVVGKVVGVSSEGGTEFRRANVPGSSSHEALLLAEKAVEELCSISGGAVVQNVEPWQVNGEWEQEPDGTWRMLGRRGKETITVAYLSWTAKGAKGAEWWVARIPGLIDAEVAGVQSGSKGMGLLIADAESAATMTVRALFKKLPRVFVFKAKPAWTIGEWERDVAHQSWTRRALGRYGEKTTVALIYRDGSWAVRGELVGVRNRDGATFYQHEEHPEPVGNALPLVEKAIADLCAISDGMVVQDVDAWQVTGLWDSAKANRRVMLARRGLIHRVVADIVWNDEGHVVGTVSMVPVEMHAALVPWTTEVDARGAVGLAEKIEQAQKQIMGMVELLCRKLPRVFVMSPDAKAPSLAAVMGVDGPAVGPWVKAGDTKPKWTRWAQPKGMPRYPIAEVWSPSLGKWEWRLASILNVLPGHGFAWSQENAMTQANDALQPIFSGGRFVDAAAARPIPREVGPWVWEARKDLTGASSPEAGGEWVRYSHRAGEPSQPVARVWEAFKAWHYRVDDGLNPRGSGGQRTTDRDAKTRADELLSRLFASGRFVEQKGAKDDVPVASAPPAKVSRRESTVWTVAPWQSLGSGREIRRAVCGGSGWTIAEILSPKDGISTFCVGNASEPGARDHDSFLYRGRKPTDVVKAKVDAIIRELCEGGRFVDGASPEPQPWVIQPWSVHIAARGVDLQRVATRSGSKDVRVAHVTEDKDGDVVVWSVGAEAFGFPVLIGEDANSQDARRRAMSEIDRVIRAICSQAGCSFRDATSTEDLKDVATKAPIGKALYEKLVTPTSAASASPAWSVPPLKPDLISKATYVRFRGWTNGEGGWTHPIHRPRPVSLLQAVCIQVNVDRQCAEFVEHEGERGS